MLRVVTAAIRRTTARTTTLRVVTIVLMAAAGLAACGTDDNSATARAVPPKDVRCATGSSVGAGSTFALNIVQQWIKNYSAACPASTINYQGIGSGGGIQQLTAGTIDFAGTDVPLSATERAAARPKIGPVVHIPWAAGAVAVEYNLRGVDDLRLSPTTLAALFSGAITRWDDPRVREDNPGVDLPGAPVQVIHRSDGSGTTAAFTAYLRAAAPQVWTSGSGKDIRWPVGQGAKGSDGVTAQVKQAEGAIGYAELSFATGSSLKTAKVRNASGAYMGPDAASVTAALAGAKIDPDRIIAIDYAAPDPAAYPVAIVTYVAMPQVPRDVVKNQLLVAFVDYALGEGQEAAVPLGYAPLPPTMRDIARSAARSLAAVGDSGAD
jgi:phosphate transport system substrate-binding protein